MLEVVTVTLFLALVLTVGALYWQGGQRPWWGTRADSN